MKQLEFAIRQYQETSPIRSGFDENSNSRLTVWYEEDLAPVLEDYSRRPRFRSYASWPITELQAGAKTELRSLIDQVDQYLVDCAQSVLEIFQVPSVYDALCSEHPPTQQVASGTWSSDDDSETVNEKDTLLCNHIEDHRMYLNYFASRPWEDLVNIQDYFGTQPKVSSVENGIAICWADTIVSLNPRLLPIGNFIVRSMLNRIRPSRKLFLDSKDLLVSIEKKLELRLWKKVEDVHRIYEVKFAELQQALKEIRKLPLIDACVALTQIYVATNDKADVEWLGLDTRTVKRGASEIKMRIRGLHGPEFHDRIATHLSRLQDLYDSEREAEIEFESQIALRSLALNSSERVVYWKGNPLNVSKKQFVLLHLLANSVKTKRTVIGNDLDAAESTSDSALSSLLDRLRKKIPMELATAIKHNGDGYYLDLSNNEVVVLNSERTNMPQS